MSDEPRPFASLSSSLLARRGSARPAMRPQAIQMAEGITSPLEDLGWNDMGEDHSVPAPATVSAPVLRHNPLVEPQPVESPAVVQQEEIARTFQPTAVVQPAPRGAAMTAAKGKAAFTLRLDAERHLQLRLLSAVQRRSSQQIVTQALDEFLERHSDQLVLNTSALGGHIYPSTGDRK